MLPMPAPLRGALLFSLPRSGSTVILQSQATFILHGSIHHLIMTLQSNRPHYIGCTRLVIILLSLLTAAVQGAENATDSEARLRQSVTYLASDELEGRGVGTTGLDKAADYLAEKFAKAGLRTDLYQGTPFQEFEITVAAELGPASRNRLTWIGQSRDGQPKRISLKLREQFTPMAGGGSGRFDAPLVFAGYGITAKDLKRGDQPLVYDDYAGLYVQDKVVIIVRKEPQQMDPASPFDGTRHSQYAAFDRKVTNASEHGAAAVIFVND